MASANGGLFVQNRIKTENGETLTPTKAIPIPKLRGKEEIIPRAQNVAERYREIHSGHLERFERNGSLQSIERRESWAYPYDLVMTFFGYTDAFPLSTAEIRTFVELSEIYSDIITPPIQIPLLEMMLYPEEGDKPEINEEDSEVIDAEKPDYFHLYQTGIERYLEVVEGSEKPISAPIPFMEEYDPDIVNYLTTLVEHDAEIDMWCYNMFRRKPTSPGHRDYILRLHELLRRNDAFEATLKYAINVRHSFKQENRYRSAEDLALAGYGFDIIGENHWSPPQSGSFSREPTARLFDHKIGAYRETAPTKPKINEIWPSLSGSSFSEEAILSAADEDSFGRVQKLVNSERIEALLSELRESIQNGTTEKFISEHRGVVDYLQDSFEIVAEEWENPDSQSTLEEHG